MSIEKKNRNSIIINLINNGMSARKIARLFGLSHTVIIRINGKYNNLNLRHCFNCVTTENLIDNDISTICEFCKKNIKLI